MNFRLLAIVFFLVLIVSIEAGKNQKRRNAKRNSQRNSQGSAPDFDKNTREYCPDGKNFLN